MKNKHRPFLFIFFFKTIFAAAMLSPAVSSADDIQLSMGQSVYVLPA